MDELLMPGESLRDGAFGVQPTWGENQ
jgi:hypothetical protein